VPFSTWHKFKPGTNIRCIVCFSVIVCISKFEFPIFCSFRPHPKLQSRVDEKAYLILCAGEIELGSSGPLYIHFVAVKIGGPRVEIGQRHGSETHF